MWRVVAGIVAAVLMLSTADAQQQKPLEPDWITDKNGCRVWNGNPQPNETITWSGACLNGVASGLGVLQSYLNGKPRDRYEGELRDGRNNGHGVYVWANGDRYDGEWKDGQSYGHGVFVAANGNRYEGESRDGHMNGHGVYVWANGDRYDGEFKDNLRNGHGVYLAANGDRYDVEWKDGHMNGHGVFVAANGTRYEGEWKDDHQSGHGVLVEADGSRYEGEFKDGQRTGHGVAVGANGNRYDGEFKDSHLNGHGVFVWPNGDRYDGEWKDDRQNGHGVLVNANGNRYEGEWKDGQLLAQETTKKGEEAFKPEKSLPSSTVALTPRNQQQVLTLERSDEHGWVFFTVVGFASPRVHPTIDGDSFSAVPPNAVICIPPRAYYPRNAIPPVNDLLRLIPIEGKAQLREIVNGDWGFPGTSFVIHIDGQCDLAVMDARRFVNWIPQARTGEELYSWLEGVEPEQYPTETTEERRKLQKVQGPVYYLSLHKSMIGRIEERYRLLAPGVNQRIKSVFAVFFVPTGAVADLRQRDVQTAKAQTSAAEDLRNRILSGAVSGLGYAYIQSPKGPGDLCHMIPIGVARRLFDKDREAIAREINVSLRDYRLVKSVGEIYDAMLSGTCPIAMARPPELKKLIDALARVGISARPAVVFTDDSQLAAVEKSIADDEAREKAHEEEASKAAEAAAAAAREEEARCNSDPECRARKAEEAKASAPAYTAVLTCDAGGAPMPVFACLVEDRSGISGRFELTSGGVQTVFTDIDFANRLGRVRVEFPLTEHFEIDAQANSESNVRLSIKITDRAGHVVFQRQATQFGVIKVRN